MKLSELKSIIMECVEELNEVGPARKHRKATGYQYKDGLDDPLKNSVKDRKDWATRGKFGSEDYIPRKIGSFKKLGEANSLNDIAKKHQRKIAKKTLKMNDVFANIMGGPNKEEAKKILKQTKPKKKIKEAKRIPVTGEDTETKLRDWSKGKFTDLEWLTREKTQQRNKEAMKAVAKRRKELLKQRREK